MDATRNAYCYQKVTGEFTHVEVAECDPETPGEWLWPANSTPLRPDRLPARWVGDRWVDDVQAVEWGLRRRREKLLAATDFFFTSDYPLAPDRRAALILYRQQLRDVTEQKAWPNAVKWPEPPTFVLSHFSFT